ncbi:MAG: DUF4142 domain-containing protein [Sphingobacteriales bacterium]|nr:MAG: DUF4142 domain-containing protein [Sphingobacteriales bacterium]
MKTLNTLLLTAAISALGMTANAQTRTTTTVTSGATSAGVTTARPSESMDGRFIGKLIALNTYEVRLLQLAQGMSRRKDLKDHAKHMLDYHQTLDKQMRDYAMANGYNSTEKKDLKYDGKIEKRSGQPAGLEWDKDIIEDIVDAHEDAIEIIRKERKNVSDQKLLAMVDAAMPRLQEHLTMLRPMESGAKEAVRTNDTTAGSHGMQMAPTAVPATDSSRMR